MKSILNCQQCPLRKLDVFKDVTSTELEFISQLKSGELAVDPKTRILDEGANSPHVFTVLEGWGLREKTLADGRRQIMNFVMPGDLLGLQSAMFDVMDHSVEALTKMTLCVFQRSEIANLFHTQPSLGHTVVWHAARSERLMDVNLLSVGQCTARERIVLALLTIFSKAERLGLVTDDGSVGVPITQQHIADALGLSLVHTNRTVKRLVSEKLVAWRAGRLRIIDSERMLAIAPIEVTPPRSLPLI